jgi:low affinity iron permease
LAVGNTDSDFAYYFSASRLHVISREKNSGPLCVLERRGPSVLKDCRFASCSVGGSTMKTQEQKLNKQKISGNFFGTVSNVFRFFARKSSVVLGSAWTFAAAVLIIVTWSLTGPKFHYSDTWQLIINTGTTIVTFLMVFLIQNTKTATRNPFI